LTVAGTSGGVPYFSSASTWATSAALAASALVVGGGAGAAPATITTGTGVTTALGVNTGTAGAFVVNGGALGTPSSGTVTNLTGTASININGTVGATTANTGAFTTITASGNVTLSGSSATIYAGSSSTLGALSNNDTSAYFAAWGSTNGTFPSQAHVIANGATIGKFSSTGLAITGAITATSIKLGSGAVLSNYEEGTWTPGLSCGTSGTITLSSPTNSGLYTRIGRQVTAYVLMSVSSVSSPVGTLTMTGLPFSCNSTTRPSGTIILNGAAATAVTSSAAIMIGGATTTFIYTRNAAGSHATNAADIQAATDIYFAITYFI